MTFFHNGRTYVLSNQWGKAEIDGVDRLLEGFAHMQIKLTASE